MIPLSRVSLVIPVYNQLLHTMQCLESILRLPDKGGELIVVDNASTDGTPEYLKELDGVTVIRNETNLGCAKAWNQGVQASKGDVIAILTNDIVVPPGWLPAVSTLSECGCSTVVWTSTLCRLRWTLGVCATSWASLRRPRCWVPWRICLPARAMRLCSEPCPHS